jgi:hypothetical protein
MGTTVDTSSDAAKIAQMIDNYEVAERDNIFGALFGGKDAPIYVVEGLEGKRKGYIKKGIQIFSQDPTSGSTGWDASEVDKEEDLTPGYEDLELEFNIKGFDLGFAAQDQYNLADFMKEHEVVAQRWISDKIEGGTTGFTGLTEQLLESPAEVFYGGDATGIGDIAAGDNLTVDMITDISTSLKVGVNVIDNIGSFTKFRKANFLGYKQKFALIMNPLGYSVLKKSDDWLNIKQNAEKRGKENPLWDGMVGAHVVGVYDNIVLMESDRMPYDATGGNAPYTRGVILGAQGGLYGRGMTMSPHLGWNRDRTKSYIYYKMIKGSKAVQFDSTTYNSAEVLVATASA